MTKDKLNIYKFIIGIFIGIIIAGIFFFVFFKEDSSNEEINQLTQEDCTELAELAETRKIDCIIKSLEEIDSITISYGLKDDGTSCFYHISTGVCYPTYKKDWRSFYYAPNDRLFFLAFEDIEESCSKSFPEKEDVFASCLANLSNS
mgnify:CR=1 FL=1